MRDDAGPDAKVLAVPAADPRFAEMSDLGDLPPYLLDEIRHFFEAYKTLEPGKFSEVRGLGGPRRRRGSRSSSSFERARGTSFER